MFGHDALTDSDVTAQLQTTTGGLGSDFVFGPTTAPAFDLQLGHFLANGPAGTFDLVVLRGLHAQAPLIEVWPGQSDVLRHWGRRATALPDAARQNLRVYGDVDGDGLEELGYLDDQAAGTVLQRFTFAPGATAEDLALIATLPISVGPFHHPVAAQLVDLDGDGTLELVAAFADGGVVIVRDLLTGPVTEVVTSDSAHGALATNLDDDPELELVVVTDTVHLYDLAPTAHEIGGVSGDHQHGVQWHDHDVGPRRRWRPRADRRRDRRDRAGPVAGDQHRTGAMRAGIGVVLLVTAVAHADPETPASAARSYFFAGQAAYQAGDYGAAALALEQADQTMHDPRTTFSLAQAYRQLFAAVHDPAYAARAVELYQTYLHELPTGSRSDDAREFSASLATLVELAKYRGTAVAARSVVPHTQLMVWSTVAGAHAAIDDRPEVALPVVLDAKPGSHRVALSAEGFESTYVEVVAVDARLVALEGRLAPRPATLHITAASDARVFVDEVEVSDPGHGHGIAVPAGHHRVWIGQRGHLPALRELDLAPGGTQSVMPSLPISTQRHRARWTLEGGGALAVTALGALGYAAWSAHHADDLLARRDVQPLTVAEGKNYASSRDSALRCSQISLGISIGAAAVAGIGLYLYLTDDPEPPRRSVLTPLIAPSTAGAALSGSF